MKKFSYLLFFVILFVNGQDLQISAYNPNDKPVYYKGPQFPYCSQTNNESETESCFNMHFANVTESLFNYKAVDLPTCDNIYIPVEFVVSENGTIQNVKVDYPKNLGIQNELTKAIYAVTSHLNSKQESIKPAVTLNGFKVDFLKRFEISIKGKGIQLLSETSSADGEKYFVYDNCSQILVYKGEDVFHKRLFNDYKDQNQFASKFESDFKANEEEIVKDLDIEVNIYDDEFKNEEYKRLSNINSNELTDDEKLELEKLYEEKLILEKKYREEQQKIAREENERMVQLLKDKHKQELKEIEKQQKIAKAEQEKMYKLYQDKLKQEKKAQEELQKLESKILSNKDKLYVEKIQKEKQIIEDQEKIARVEREKLLKLYNEKLEIERNLKNKEAEEIKKHQNNIQKLEKELKK